MGDDHRQNTIEIVKREQLNKAPPQTRLQMNQIVREQLGVRLAFSSLELVKKIINNPLH